MNRSDEIPVHELRDYARINAEAQRLLHGGRAHIRLTGVSGQRLLLAGLRGRWNATIELDGHAGPELAAELDAPGLVIIVRGNVADGAARDLVDGSVIVQGSAAAALGYRLRGGVCLVNGGAGARAGLEQQGGTILVQGPLGPLAGDRQSGGLLIGLDPSTPAHPGHGQTGGVRWLAGLDHAHPRPRLPSETRGVLERLDHAGILASAGGNAWMEDF
jgi:glutamate synthase domain-containing protein 3